MDKPTKRDTAFCERDALADMRQAEREVLRAYAAAAAEGGSRRLRTLLAQNFAAAAEDMYAVDCAMRALRQRKSRGHTPNFPAAAPICPKIREKGQRRFPSLPFGPFLQYFVRFPYIDAGCS